MSRKSFNWSALDRNMLYSLLYQLKNQIVGNTLSVEQISKLISKHIKFHLPIRITSNRYKNAKHNEIWIGGLYHSDYDQKGYSRFIELKLMFAEYEKSVTLTNYRFKRICRVFADTMLHEIIHCRQFRARNFKEIPMYQSTAEYARERRQQEYYGDRDEMGAYAFNIACSMFDKFGWNPAGIRKYLDNTPIRSSRLTAWQSFLKAFDWDHNHPRVRQMKHKIISQLEYAKIGKPFLTDNHLTY